MQRPQKVVKPRSAPISARASAVRVLPIPGSPVSITMRPRPDCASPSAAASFASSGSRPTKGSLPVDEVIAHSPEYDEFVGMIVHEVGLLIIDKRVSSQPDYCPPRKSGTSIGSPFRFTFSIDIGKILLHVTASYTSIGGSISPATALAKSYITK